jgi:ABC-type lipoprotein export system ATPase subunit
VFIERMLVKRFRHLRNVELGPFRQPAQIGELIVLAGPNGSGKSSLLELLSLGIANRYNYQYYQARQMTEHAFGIRLAFSEDELTQIEAESADTEVTEYLRRTRGYWVHVNMPELFGPNEQPVNDRVHAITSREFANFGRRLGFFIRSDRSYGARAYRRDQIFGWKNRMQPQYFQGLSYSATNTQYEDMYDYLVEQSYHYVYELGLHSRRQLRGEASVGPSDPLQPYNALLGQLFPGYEFQEVAADDFMLKVKIPSGDVIAFQDMSSGEKEVFFILAFFIRNDVSAAPIIIDEPELHLHPELARKFIRHMRNVRPENQIWIATHSADLIDEAGRERTIYVRRRADDPSVAECIPADSEESEIAVLRDLFGYSGFVGISKKVVFSEGNSASADRKTFTSLFPQLADEIKIIPAGSATNLHRINRAILALLESDFARCEFYLIRDRDYLSDDAVRKHAAMAEGRLFILDRCQIENYLLDEDAIAELLQRVFHQSMSTAEVRAELFQIAAANSAACLRDMVVTRYAELYQQEDCSIGNHSEGMSVVDPSGESSDAIVGPLRLALREKMRAINGSLQERLDPNNLDTVFNECHSRVREALDPDTDMWKVVFPGKAILQRFSASRNLGRWPALQNLAIEAMAQTRPASLGDLREIFERIGAK